MFQRSSERRHPAADGGDGGATYSSGANHRRYRHVASHLVPRTAAGKMLVAAFVGVFLLAEWPVLSLANRIEPAIGGVPFLFVYLLAVYIALIGILMVAAYLEL